MVQICPVGALTAQPYRFQARPWDLQQVESTCTNCAVGCRTAVQSSAGELTRLIGVDSDPVNWGWLCDKGSAFAFRRPRLPAPSRLSVPLVRGSFATSWSRPAGAEALKARAANGGLCRGQAKEVSGGGASIAGRHRRFPLG